MTGYHGMLQLTVYEKISCFFHRFLMVMIQTSNFVSAKSFLFACHLHNIITILPDSAVQKTRNMCMMVIQGLILTM